MKTRSHISALVGCFNRLSLTSTFARPSSATAAALAFSQKISRPSTVPSFQRGFSSTPINNGNWLLPTEPEKKRSRKGRPRVPTGGSSRGTTIVWGDYGLRMSDHHRRVSAAQLKVGEDAIKVRLRGMRYRLYKRVCASIGVYTSGNEVRMGKGKGTFDHWASRIAVSKIIFELKGDIHEQVARDAFRLAGNKMPGQYEFVKRGDPPVVGITKLGDGVTMEQLKRPRRAVPLGSIEAGTTATTASNTVSSSMSPDA